MGFAGKLPNNQLTGWLKLTYSLTPEGCSLLIKLRKNVRLSSPFCSADTKCTGCSGIASGTSSGGVKSLLRAFCAASRAA
jgi:hypothetical protein